VALGWLALKSVALESFQYVTIKREPIHIGLQATSDLILDISRRLLSETAEYRRQFYQLYLLSFIVEAECEHKTPSPERLATQRRLVLNYLNPDPGSAEYTIEKAIDQYGRLVSAYDNTLYMYLRNIELQLARVEICKKALASDLGIEGRKLCDELFQFSPATYRSLISKIRSNVHTIRTDLAEQKANLAQYSADPKQDAASPPSTPIDNNYIDRLSGLIRQSERLYRHIENICERQHDVLRAPEAMEFMIQICREHTPSGALQTYASALEELSRKPNGGFEMRLLAETQNVHPLIDSHETLKDIMRHKLQDKRAEPISHERASRSFKALKQLETTQHTHRTIISEARNSNRIELSSFTGLLRAANDFIYEQRSKIRIEFSDRISRLMRVATRTNRQLWLVPLNHSRSVKTALQSFVGGTSEEASSKLSVVIFAGGSARNDAAIRTLRAELLYETQLLPTQVRTLESNQFKQSIQNMDKQGIVVLISSIDSMTTHSVRLSGPEPAQLLTALDPDLSLRWTRLVVMGETYKSRDELSTSERTIKAFGTPVHNASRLIMLTA
jgi:hypothetical protein